MFISVFIMVKISTNAHTRAVFCNFNLNWAFSATLFRK